LSSEVL
jgi:hypothetical protein